MIKPIKHNMKYFAITGTFHGSIIEAKCEGDARRRFHDYYKGESIIFVKILLNIPS
jgi:hypothetical protein